MPFIVPIVATVFGLGAIGSTIVGLGLAAGAQFLISGLTKKKDKESQPTGIQQSLEVGGDRPRSGILGRTATPGHLGYVNTYGTDNKFYQVVYMLGDCPHDGLEKIWVDGKPCSLVGGPNSFTVTEYPGMTVRFFEGQIDQAADSELVNHATPSTRWTANHRLAGIAYVSITMSYDEKLYSGFPTFLFQVRGLRLYDPRKDSTNGGTGPHRWNVPSTWEWTANSAIAAYNYRRGFFLNGQRVLGIGNLSIDLNTQSYISAANTCDEDVTLKDSLVTEKRYRCGFQVFDGDEHSENIKKLVASMAGMELERAGEFTLLAGVYTPPVITITDDDIILGPTRSYTAYLPRPDRVNAVFGTYADPVQQWASIAFPGRTSSADESADGERFGINVDLSFVFSGTQAQRLAEIERRKSRAQATAALSLSFKFIILEPGDTIRWQSSRYQFDKLFVVQKTALSPEKLVTIQIRETNSTIYNWNSAVDELAIGAAVDLPGEAPRLSTVTGLTASSISINGTDGQVRPALKANWPVINDRTVDAVSLQYRIANTLEIVTVPYASPTDGEAIILQGIQANTNYEIRGTITTTPARLATYTAWIPVTSNGLYVVPQAQTVSPGGVDSVAISTELQNFIKFDLPNYFEQTRSRLFELEQIVADQDASQLEDRFVDARTASSQFENSRASVQRLDAAITSAQSAFAQSIVDLNAQINDNIATAITSLTTQVTTLNNTITSQATAITAIQAVANGISASGLIKFQAVADSSLGSIIAYDIQLSLSDAPGSYYNSGLRIVLWQSSPGVVRSRIILKADEVYIGDDGSLRFKRNPITGAGTIEIYSNE